MAGRRLLTADGAPWFGVGASWFTGLQDWIVNREKALRYIAWMVDRHVQWGRVFLMFNGGIGRFIPAEHADFFSQLRAFVEACGDLGRRLEIVVNADCQNPPLTFDPAFYDRVNEALAGAWNILASSGGNEAPFNGFNPALLRKPAGLLSARGSMGTDEAPFLPPWDLAIYETPRDEQFARKYKGVFDIYAAGCPVPVLIDEMVGIGDVSEPDRTTNDPFKCWQLAAGSKLMGAAGICAHLRTGITGDVPAPGGAAEHCVDAMVAAGALPLGAHAFGRYERGLSPAEGQNPNLPIVHHDYEFETGVNAAGSLRTHALIDGGQAEVIAPGPGHAYRAEAANGWRIVTAYAFADQPANVLVCER